MNDGADSIANFEEDENPDGDGDEDDLDNFEDYQWLNKDNKQHMVRLRKDGGRR